MVLGGWVYVMLGVEMGCGLSCIGCTRVGFYLLTVAFRSEKRRGDCGERGWASAASAVANGLRQAETGAKKTLYSLLEANFGWEVLEKKSIHGCTYRSRKPSHYLFP